MNYGIQKNEYKIVFVNLFLYSPPEADPPSAELFVDEDPHRILALTSARYTRA